MSHINLHKLLDELSPEQETELAGLIAERARQKRADELAVLLAERYAPARERKAQRDAERMKNREAIANQRAIWEARRIEAVRMRESGMTFRAIGEALGVSGTGARGLIARHHYYARRRAATPESEEVSK